MKNLLYFLLFTLCSCFSCTDTSRTDAPANLSDYFDYSQHIDKLSGGIQMIPINTPKGTFNVWTKRIGNNPRIKVLLLHGGPGGTHEIFECFDSFFPREGFEYYLYDQLGSYYSDQPKDSSLWEIDRFVDEVEQVRRALSLSKDNFYLYGVSWGGILAMEYALKHQQHIKGLILSNIMASAPLYERYANEVLAVQMPAAVLAEVRELEAAGDYENPRYMQLLIEHYYEKHSLRMPFAEWPEPVMRTFKHMNPDIYIPMQGPSEFGVSGKLAKWDRTADLPRITVPTLTISALHGTMDPAHVKWMAGQLPRGRYWHCPNGSHSALYDDQEIYFEGLIRFIRDVDAGRFPAP